MLLQVELYSDYEPSRLMGFLISSQSYGLEAAHELCKRKGLVREQVIVDPFLCRQPVKCKQMRSLDHIIDPVWKLNRLARSDESASGVLQVFVLGRMGNAHEALHLIIRRLADIPQAGLCAVTRLLHVHRCAALRGVR